MRYTNPVVPPYTLRGIEFLGGVRRGIALPAAEVERATQALRQLDTVTHFLPECSEQFDTIMAIGLIGRRRAVVFLGWSENRLQTHPPEFLGDLR